jgi:drug/metabolite transporter (DMT)-like permease
MVKAFFILVLMNVLWAGTYTVIKIGLGTMQPLSLIFWRMGVAAVVLWAYVLIRGFKWNFGLRDFLRMLSMGAVIAGSHILWVTGMKFTNASDAALLYAFEPIWSIILASLILKERFLPMMGAGLVLALIGMVILSKLSFSSIESLFMPSVALGNLLVVTGLFMESLYSILAKPIAGRQSSAVVVAVALAAAELILVIPTFALEGFHPPATAGEIIIILYLSIPCTVVGYALWVRVMRRLPVNVMLYTIFVQPVTGPFIAFLVLGEILDSRIFGGGSFILAGVALAVYSHIKAHREMHALTASPAVVLGEE